MEERRIDAKYNFLQKVSILVYTLLFDVNKKKNIQYKIGVSYVSVENARENLKAEMQNGISKRYRIRRRQNGIIIWV